MVIVKVDNKYAIRRGWWIFKEYLDLDNLSYWWLTREYAMEHCFTEDLELLRKIIKNKLYIKIFKEEIIE